MLEKYSYNIYLMSKLFAFILFSYLILTYIPSQNTLMDNDVFNTIISLAIMFIVLDNYFPNIYYDKD